MLLTGPFGGLTDDVREFLLCLADERAGEQHGWASLPSHVMAGVS